MPLRLCASIQSLSATPIFVGVLLAHPDVRAAARERQHEQVVLVLRVDRPLRVRREVAHHHVRLAVVADLRVAGERREVERRAVGRQALADLGHPVVVEEEVLAPGERVPGLPAFDVDGEGRVAATAVLAAGPLPRRDDRLRPALRVGEGDLLALVLAREVGELHAGALLELLEARDGDRAVGDAGQREDRLARLLGRLQQRPAVGDAAARDAVDLAQVLDGVGLLERDALDHRAEVLDVRAERGHHRRDVAVVALHHREVRHRLAGDRLALPRAPVEHAAAGLRRSRSGCRGSAAWRRRRSGCRAAARPSR